MRARWRRSARAIRIFDYGPLFADPFRQSIRAHVDRIAAKECLEVEYVKKPKGYRKEDGIREIVAKRGNHSGLAHIFSVMELSRRTGHGTTSERE